MRDHFAALGVDQSEMQRQGFRLQTEVIQQMRGKPEGAARGDGSRGIFRLSRRDQQRFNEFLFPSKPESELAPWHLPALRMLRRAALAGDKWLRART